MQLCISRFCPPGKALGTVWIEYHENDRPKYQGWSMGEIIKINQLPGPYLNNPSYEWNRLFEVSANLPNSLYL